MFRQEFEFLTSNTRIAYPFVDRVEAPTSADGRYFSDVIADVFLLYNPKDSQHIRLDYLSDPAGPVVHVRFVYEDGTTAFEDMDGVPRTFGSWTIIEFFSGTGEARLLLQTSEIAGYAWPAAPVDAWLVPHALQERLANVSHVVAVIDETLKFEFDGVVELEGGFNTNVGLATGADAHTTTRGRQRVRIDVAPGLGLGRVPTCEKDVRLLTVNGIGPDDNGNIRLDAVDCYRWELPRVQETAPGVWQLEPSKLMFFQQCEPCCQCIDYITVYDDLLRSAYNRGKLASIGIYSARDEYLMLIERMEAERACRQKRWVEVRATALHGWTLSVQAIINNDGPCDAEFVEMEVAIEAYTDDGEPVLGQIVGNTAILYNEEKQSQPITLTGDYPTVSFTDPMRIRWTKKVVLSFSVYFTEGGGRAAGLPVTVNAAALLGGEYLPEAQAYTAIPAPFNK